MSMHQARVSWQRSPTERFVDSRYSRAHTWEFDGGASIPASSAVSSVPLPYSRADHVDPEEALVAAVASCHMLFFLGYAAKENFLVDAYDDTAMGTMTRDDCGKTAVTAVHLAPRVIFRGPKIPTDVDVARLHHAAHEDCYIANSVRAEVLVAGQWTSET